MVKADNCRGRVSPVHFIPEDDLLVLLTVLSQRFVFTVDQTEIYSRQNTLF